MALTLIKDGNTIVRSLRTYIVSAHAPNLYIIHSTLAFAYTDFKFEWVITDYNGQVHESIYTYPDKLKNSRLDTKPFLKDKVNVDFGIVGTYQPYAYHYNVKVYEWFNGARQATSYTFLNGLSDNKKYNRYTTLPTNLDTARDWNGSQNGPHPMIHDQVGNILVTLGSFVTNNMAYVIDFKGYHGTNLAFNRYHNDYINYNYIVQKKAQYHRIRIKFATIDATGPNQTIFKVGGSYSEDSVHIYLDNNGYLHLDMRENGGHDENIVSPSPLQPMIEYSIIARSTSNSQILSAQQVVFPYTIAFNYNRSITNTWQADTGDSKTAEIGGAYDLNAWLLEYDSFNNTPGPINVSISDVLLDDGQANTGYNLSTDGLLLPPKNMKAIFLSQIPATFSPNTSGTPILSGSSAKIYPHGLKTFDSTATLLYKVLYDGYSHIYNTSMTPHDLMLSMNASRSDVTNYNVGLGSTSFYGHGFDYNFTCPLNTISLEWLGLDGGYENFPFELRTETEVNVKNKSFNKDNPSDYESTTSFEKEIYQQDINTRILVRTGWLTKEQEQYLLELPIAKKIILHNGLYDYSVISVTKKINATDHTKNGLVRKEFIVEYAKNIN